MVRALTLHQPWAWCIMRAGKRIENRTWYPPADLIGQRIAIHAGKREDISASIALRSVPRVLSLGAFVGTARLVAVIRRIEDVRSDQLFWWAGPVGWLLDEVRELPRPLSCRGAQGLWTVPERFDLDAVAA